MYRINEHYKITLETGKWWTIPWWQDDKYYADGLYTKEQADTAFTELIKVFDAEWLLRQKTVDGKSFRDGLAMMLFGEGFFRHLVALGGDLHNIKNAGNKMDRKICDIERRLKNSAEYWEAAWFELKILSLFHSQGFNIEADCRSGYGKCNCDCKISDGCETVFFIEAKRPSDFHKKNNEVLDKGSNRITKLISTGNIKESDLDEYMSFSQKVEIEKVFVHVRKAVREQLPKEGYGIVIVYPPVTLDRNMFKDTAKCRFKKNKSYYSNLLAIVLAKCDIEYSWEICVIPNAINGSAKTLEIICSLQKSLN